MFKIGTIHFRKKEIYLGLSFVLCIFLFGILVNDFISILEKEMPENTTQGFTLTILLLHVIAFSQALLGLIYNSLADKPLGMYLGIISATCNVVIFLIRIIFELVYLEFRREELGVSA